jgi:dTDP-3,4-didehydro-2,6-dideoxy-alpha-D-glucose 3-reductase
MKHSHVRIGILGCAKIARRSMAPAIRKLPDHFTLVAAASRERSTAEAFASEFGCEAVVGYQGLIARDDVDALYVPLPTGLHAQWIAAAVAVGKHVYAEKSFASSAALATELVDAARVREVAVMEGYMFLYHRQQAVIAEQLRQGAIGELRHFHGSFGFPPLPATDFRFDEILGGGVLLDAAGYPLRAAQRVLGDGLLVQAATLARCPVRGTSLWGSAFLSNGQGLGASIAFGFDNFYQCRYELWGSRGKLTAERAYTPGPGMSPRLVLETAAGAEVQEVEPDDHFVGALKVFHQAINDPLARQQQYDDIERQSRSLDRIRDLAAVAAADRD